MKFTIPNIGGHGSYTCNHFIRWCVKLGIGLGVMDIARGFTKGVFVGIGNKLVECLDSEKEKLEKKTEKLAKELNSEKGEDISEVETDE